MVVKTAKISRIRFHFEKKKTFVDYGIIHSVSSGGSFRIYSGHMKDLIDFFKCFKQTNLQCLQMFLLLKKNTWNQLQYFL